MLRFFVSGSKPDHPQSSPIHIYALTPKMILHKEDHYRYSDKEILLARFTEEDVLAGRLVSEGSTLRVLVNKALGEPVDAE